MDDWVLHFVEEERRRSVAERRDAAAAAQQKAHARLHFRSLVDSLRARVAHDVEIFAREFPDRALELEETPLDGGFTLRRGHYPVASLAVEPDLDAGTIVVQYVFASQSGTLRPPPLFLEVGGQSTGALHFRDEAGQHAFRTMAQLSEYLLVPVFTGRPR